jgi:la-related protein 1
MDSRGWIPISLLASFNRVRHLTLDPQLVRDVLALSQVLEMRDDCVRMTRGEWAQFVLPDAPASTVEGAASAVAGEGEDGRGGQDQDREHGDDDGDMEEEEEEEEIEIVMDREVIGQPWMTPSSS